VPEKSGRGIFAAGLVERFSSLPVEEEGACRIRGCGTTSSSVYSPNSPASWSPDGDQIAFAGQRDGVWNVWAVSRRTRVTRQLTHFSAPSDYVSYPSWSPDGGRIAFAREIRRGSVWTVQVQ
jgi:dipeptidyl aminopeptidase/acylaminoacyl peptidase